MTRRSQADHVLGRVASMRERVAARRFDAIRARYEAMPSSPWFKAAHDGKSIDVEPRDEVAPMKAARARFDAADTATSVVVGLVLLAVVVTAWLGVKHWISS